MILILTKRFDDTFYNMFYSDAIHFLVDRQINIITNFEEKTQTLN